MIDKNLHPKLLKQEELLDYKNSDLFIYQRVDDLIKRITLEEKIAQMICIWGKKMLVK